jgi:endoglucanase
MICFKSLALGLMALLLPAAQALSAVAPFESVSSMEAVQRMGLGWNLGNTLEAGGDWVKDKTVHGYETAWGNPDTTRAMIAKVRQMGFSSVRIPVGWSSLMGPNYTINPALLRRVAEVVGWVQAEGMVAVVNIHWDGGWWTKFSTHYSDTMFRYTRMWSQIADTFKNYPGTLIFESLNEEGHFDDIWDQHKNSGQKSKAYEIVNNINQAFVKLVRESGGMNAKRHLLIAGYSTDIDRTVDPFFKMPSDPANHCILSIHYYTPWPFAGMNHDESWGKARYSWGTGADIVELDNNLKKLKVRFLDKGVPVIMGEYGMASKKSQANSRLYVLTVAEKAYRLGICPMLWDAGGGILDRRKLEIYDPLLLQGYHKILAMPRAGSPVAP